MTAALDFIWVRIKDYLKGLRARDKSTSSYPYIHAPIITHKFEVTFLTVLVSIRYRVLKNVFTDGRKRFSKIRTSLSFLFSPADFHYFRLVLFFRLFSKRLILINSFVSILLFAE